MNWELSPDERAALERSCEASGVPLTVEDDKAIGDVVAMLVNGTAGGRHG